MQLRSKKSRVCDLMDKLSLRKVRKKKNLKISQEKRVLNRPLVA